MSIEDDTLDELVKALKRVDNKALAVQIKKGESYLDYLSREHIQDLKSILELRIRFCVEEEEERKILEKSPNKSLKKKKKKKKIFLILIF